MCDKVAGSSPKGSKKVAMVEGCCLFTSRIVAMSFCDDITFLTSCSNGIADHHFNIHFLLLLVEYTENKKADLISASFVVIKLASC